MKLYLVLYSLIFVFLIGCENNNDLLTPAVVSEIVIECSTKAKLDVKNDRYTLNASVDKECADDILFDD